MPTIILQPQPTAPTQHQGPTQAHTDEQLLALWLHGRARTTQQAYASDAERFLLFVRKPLRSVTLADLHAFSDILRHLAPSSQARTLAAIKSLFTFAHRVGYVTLNVGAALRLPKRKDTLAERILPEVAMQRMLALEPNRRNRVLILLLYASGARVSELCALRWRDAIERETGGQVVLYGKGGKTRVVLLSAGTWAELGALRGTAGPDAPVFRSRKGGTALTPQQVERIVKAAAKRAELPDTVSPHWLRHAHASHALDRGAPVSLVRDTLGHASLHTTSRYTHARPGDSSALWLPL